MYEGYIIESPPMCDLFWQYVNLKYPDMPLEFHETSSKSIDTLNNDLQVINEYFRDILDDDDIEFINFADFIEYVLDNHPSEIDPDVLNIYLNSIETIVGLISFKFKDNLKLINRIGDVLITLE